MFSLYPSKVWSKWITFKRSHRQFKRDHWGTRGVERGQCLKEQTGNPAQTEMSALGQKQTCAAQQVMSALLPIATAKAKFPKRPCLLYSQKRTCALQLGMPAFQSLAAVGVKRWAKSSRTLGVIAWREGFCS